MKIAHRGMEAIVASTVFTALALFVVCVRLYTRFFIVRYAGLEDYFAILAMLFSIGFTVCIAMQAEYGMGHHIQEINPTQTRKSLKAFWVSLSSYYLSLTLTKMSILLQYKRVFISKKFQRACWVILVINVLFGIWCVIGSVFACRPIQAFWTREPAKCFNQIIMWFTNAAFIIATDFALIALPMPVIRQLQLPPRQKHILIAIFAVGGFVCLVSILRLHSLIAIANSTDPTYTNSPAATWTAVEINIGIICACLPVLRPLLVRRCPKLFSRIDVDGHRISSPRGYRHSRQLSAPIDSIMPKREPSIDSESEMFARAIAVVTVVDVTTEGPYALPRTESRGDENSSVRGEDDSDDNDKDIEDDAKEKICMNV